MTSVVERLGSWGFELNISQLAPRYVPSKECDAECRHAPLETLEIFINTDISLLDKECIENLDDVSWPLYHLSRSIDNVTHLTPRAIQYLDLAPTYFDNFDKCLTHTEDRKIVDVHKERVFSFIRENRQSCEEDILSYTLAGYGAAEPLVPRNDTSMCYAEFVPVGRLDTYLVALAALYGKVSENVFILPTRYLRSILAAELLVDERKKYSLKEWSESHDERTLIYLFCGTPVTAIAPLEAEDITENFAVLLETLPFEEALHGAKIL